MRERGKMRVLQNYFFTKALKQFSMIQRIQTIFLLLAMVAVTGFLLLPSISSEYGKQYSSIPGWKVAYFNEGLFYYMNLIFLCTGMGFTLIAIFLFKKRNIQLILSLLPLVFLISSAIFTYYKYYTKPYIGDVILQPWILLLAVAAVFHLLAARAIRNDEALVQSLDRLR